MPGHGVNYFIICRYGPFSRHGEPAVHPPDKVSTRYGYEQIQAMGCLVEIAVPEVVAGKGSGDTEWLVTGA
jgi:hypothetical protein